MNIDEYVKNATFIPTVVAYLVDDKGNVSLGYRKTELGYGNLTGIGGKIGDDEKHVDETPDEALVRELQEELGVVPLEYESYGLVRFLYPHKPTKNMQTIPYLVTSWKGAPKETEALVPATFEKGKIPFKEMWADNKIWVPMVLKRVVVQCDILYNSDGKVQDYIFR